MNIVVNINHCGRDEDIKEHISLKSFRFLSTISIYFIVEKITEGNFESKNKCNLLR